MKPSTRQNFKAGNYISNLLDQIANNIIFHERDENEQIVATNCVTSFCSNITGIYDCEFDINKEVRERPHSTFLVRASGDSMDKAGIKDGDILLVTSSMQAVNNSIVVAEINNCLCLKRIKYLGNNFVLFSENDKYPPIRIQKTDNFMIWGVVLSTLDKM